MIAGAIIGVLLVISGTKDDDDSSNSSGRQCRTIISPNPAGGLGTSTQVCD